MNHVFHNTPYAIWNACQMSQGITEIVAIRDYFIKTYVVINWNVHECRFNTEDILVGGMLNAVNYKFI